MNVALLSPDEMRANGGGKETARKRMRHALVECNRLDLFNTIKNGFVTLVVSVVTNLMMRDEFEVPPASWCAWGAMNLPLCPMRSRMRRNTRPRPFTASSH